MAVQMDARVAWRRRRFSVAEYERMGEVGILGEDDRVELIRGEILELAPIGHRHAAFVNNLTQLLVTRLGGEAIVSVQNPVVVADDSLPQPDLVLLRRRQVPYKDARPTAADVLLLIEVADSSLAYDRTVKLRLYADAGVPEYWVVDAAGEAVERHRGPTAGGYAEVTRVTGDATISLAAFPEVTLSLREIFA
jgi:Uma2 family endonuclease